MADCERCKEPLRNYQWALVANYRNGIDQVCLSCLIKEKFPELKDYKYLNDTNAKQATESKE